MSNVVCALLGHRVTFRALGHTMSWDCDRGCGYGGSKRYPSAEEASLYATAFDHRATAELGRRAPLIGLFPLRLWYRMRGGAHS